MHSAQKNFDNKMVSPYASQTASFSLFLEKYNSGRSRAHLAAPTEWVLSQTNESCLCKLISPFTLGLYGSPHDYVIHAGIIATTRVALITSFQPPLSRSMPSCDYSECSLPFTAWHFQRVTVQLVLQAPTHFCRRREGSGELRLQAVSHQNAISWMM